MVVKAVGITSEEVIRRVIAFVLLAAAPLVAGAAPLVWLNAPPSAITDADGVWTARERLSRAGSVDQMLFEQPNPAGYPAADWRGSRTTSSSAASRTTSRSGTRRARR